jgi:hypothetical protein
MLDVGHLGITEKYYDGGSVLAERDSKAALLELLQPVDSILNWGLDIHFETVLKERKKQLQ